MHIYVVAPETGDIEKYVKEFWRPSSGDLSQIITKEE